MKTTYTEGQIDSDTYFQTVTTTFTRQEMQDRANMMQGLFGRQAVLPRITITNPSYAKYLEEHPIKTTEQGMSEND